MQALARQAGLRSSGAPFNRGRRQLEACIAALQAKRSSTQAAAPEIVRGCWAKNQGNWRACVRKTEVATTLKLRDAAPPGAQSAWRRQHRAIHRRAER